MAELTPEQSKYVEMLITKLMGERGVNRSEAINQLHLFACKGACTWYKNSGGPGTRFDPASQARDERETVDRLMDHLAAECNLTKKELMKWFHIFK